MSHFEHAYQYGKLRDEELAEWLITCLSPRILAATAHKAFHFVWDIVDDWNQIKYSLMLELLRAKLG